MCVLMFNATAETQKAEQTNSNKTPLISVQLHSVKKDIINDFEGTLIALSKMGFDGVELAGRYGSYANDPQGLKTFLDSLNLRVSGAHIPTKSLLGDKGIKTFTFLKALGTELAIIPHDKRIDDPKKIDEFIAELIEISKLADSMGMKVGYPINYVPRSIEHLKTLFVDNSYLKFDLVKENGWSESLKSKISVLYTPYQSHPNGKESKIELEWEKDKKSLTRKKIFWAGRFDRQKRFDLVVKLAERNPEFDFWVWGAAMLSDSNSELIIPDNLKLHGLFQTYSELPLESCDLWLYTSQWDGVPTILIEKPVTLVGMGDTISSISLVAAR